VSIKRITPEEIVTRAMPVRPLTSIAERECVARHAMDVPAQGSILEIGCLYGGMTAVLGIAAPTAKITVMDDFSWHPSDDVPTSKALLLENMQKVGLSPDQFNVMEGDSRVFGATWNGTFDMCWIDGGHSYEYVFLDLIQFGGRSNVIAIHDYGNPHWASIQKAVDEFLYLKNGLYSIVEVVDTVAILYKV
jgi:predicted O-methyltransferase YrrM